jgi:hypothetical protein
MNTIQKDCLHCKYYRLDGVHSGVCRLEKKGDGIYPVKQHGDSCPSWHNCGQQFYIRKGWIRARKEAERQGS